MTKLEELLETAAARGWSTTQTRPDTVTLTRACAVGTESLTLTLTGHRAPRLAVAWYVLGKHDERTTDRGRALELVTAPAWPAAA